MKTPRRTAIEQLDSITGGDGEAAQQAAITVLLNFIEELGFHDVSLAYAEAQERAEF